MCVRVSDRDWWLWRDDECMILHTSEHLSDRDRQTDRGRMNDIRIRALEQRIFIGTHCFCWVLNVVCVFYLLRKPFPQMPASEASIGIRRSLLNPRVFLYTCVHVAGVCISISATDEVLNYKAFRYGGIVCYSSVWVLNFYGRSQGDKPLDAVT